MIALTPIVNILATRDQAIRVVKFIMSLVINIIPIRTPSKHVVGFKVVYFNSTIISHLNTRIT